MTFNDVCTYHTIFPFQSNETRNSNTAKNPIDFRINEYIPVDPEKCGSEVCCVEHTLGDFGTTRYRMVIYDGGKVVVYRFDVNKTTKEWKSVKVYNCKKFPKKKRVELTEYSKRGTLTRIDFLMKILSRGTNDDRIKNDIKILSDIKQDLIEDDFFGSEDWSYPYEHKRVGVVDVMEKVWNSR